MKGMIKFYNKDKGFGFVVGENNQEYYFNHKAIAYGELPAAGCHCEFEIDTTHCPKNKQQNQSIKSIKIIKTTNNGNKGNKIVCQHCGSQCIPRLYFSQGTATHSVCPFCGKNIKVFIDESFVDKLPFTFGLGFLMKKHIRSLKESTNTHK